MVDVEPSKALATLVAGEVEVLPPLGIAASNKDAVDGGEACPEKAMSHQCKRPFIA